MYEIETKTILTPQNGFNIYRNVIGKRMVEPARSVNLKSKADGEGIGIKKNADILLENALKKKKNRGMLLTGTTSDPYNEAEEQYKILRKCLKVVERYDYGITIETNSPLILRDIDILMGIHAKTKCVVITNLSTMDDELYCLMEEGCTEEERKKQDPGVKNTKLKEHLDMIRTLTAHNIPVELHFSPLIPMINDTEENLQQLLQFAWESKVKIVSGKDWKTALPRGTREYFYQALSERFPDIYDAFCAKFGIATELNLPEKDKFAKNMKRFCIEHQIMCDKVEIADFKRKYENETESDQMSLDSFL